MVKKHFAKLAKGKKPQQEKARIASGPNLVTKETEQVHLLMAFGGPGFHDKPRYYPTQLLSLILGGTSSSRLFQKVREKRGLVYTVSSSHSGFSDAGLFQIYAGTDPKRLRELVPVMCDELRDVQKNIKPGELARARAQIRADILMGKENVMRRAEVLGHQMLAYGKPIPAEVTLQKLMAVGLDDVKKQAKAIFSKKPVIAALGPLEELEQYNKIVARLAA
jgi:predicted Zn-dependent peptidase